MAVWTRRLSLVLLAGVVGLSIGCDAATLAYFFLPDATEPAKIKSLGSADAKKVPRVVIVSYAGMEIRSEFIHADREICEKLGMKLRQLTEGNSEKLEIVASRKVEDYKNNHPNWAQDVAALGRKLGADYVIYLEINSMSMYETGSYNSMFRGRARLNVSLIDVEHPDDTPSQKPVSCIYPTEATGPVLAGFDKSPEEFREAFLESIAKTLSYYFSRYPKRLDYMPE